MLLKGSMGEIVEHFDSIYGVNEDKGLAIIDDFSKLFFLHIPLDFSDNSLKWIFYEASNGRQAIIDLIVKNKDDGPTCTHSIEFINNTWSFVGSHCVL